MWNGRSREIVPCLFSSSRKFESPCARFTRGRKYAKKEILAGGGDGMGEQGYYVQLD